MLHHVSVLFMLQLLILVAIKQLKSGIAQPINFFILIMFVDDVQLADELRKLRKNHILVSVFIDIAKIYCILISALIGSDSTKANSPKSIESLIYLIYSNFTRTTNSQSGRRFHFDRHRRGG